MSKPLYNFLSQKVAHVLFRARSFNIKNIKKFAKGIEHQDILELGSGGKREENKYSARKYFSGSNNFIQSDVMPDSGHPIVDAVRMDFKEKYDIVLCLNVLEHVFDYQQAINNIHKALKQGGTAVISVPAFYPWHSQPNDFWRFSEYALGQMLAAFSKIEIARAGLKQFPSAYFITAVK